LFLLLVLILVYLPQVVLLLDFQKFLQVLLILVLVLIAAPAFSQTWVTANQVTLAWNAVPKVQPTDQDNKYQVYTKVGVAGTPQKVGVEIIATQQAITFSAEGRYFLCAQAVRYPQGETVGIPSTISCSDVAVNVQGGVPFGVVYFVAPAGPGGLRLVP
jgi:Zn-dependent protease with chaperone function